MHRGRKASEAWRLSQTQHEHWKSRYRHSVIFFFFCFFFFFFPSKNFYSQPHNGAFPPGPTGTRETTRLMLNRRKKHAGLIASYDSLPLLNLSFLSQSKQICVTVDQRLSNTQRHGCQHCNIWTLLTHTVTSSVEVRVCRRRLCYTDHRAPGCHRFGRTCAQKVIHWSCWKLKLEMTWKCSIGGFWSQ